MDLFAVDFGFNELQFLRQSLDLVTIKGTDAKFLASLQIKIETELAEIQRMLTQQDVEKQAALQEIIEREEKKAKKQSSNIPS
jgi:Tfp pilus assembly protein PilN